MNSLQDNSGCAEVPVHVAEGLTAAQVKAYRLIDNRNHDVADWDLELLGPELEELLLTGERRPAG